MIFILFRNSNQNKKKLYTTKRISIKSYLKPISNHVLFSDNNSYLWGRFRPNFRRHYFTANGKNPQLKRKSDAKTLRCIHPHIFYTSQSTHIYIVYTFPRYILVRSLERQWPKDATDVRVWMEGRDRRFVFNGCFEKRKGRNHSGLSRLNRTKMKAGRGGKARIRIWALRHIRLVDWSFSLSEIFFWLLRGVHECWWRWVGVFEMGRGVWVVIEATGWVVRCVVVLRLSFMSIICCGYLNRTF